MTPIKKWLESLHPTKRDARKTSREKTPLLAAYFWDGGSPVAHTVRNISPSGFYLLTEERWSIGTLIMMTLQRTGSMAERANCSVIVMSKVIRHGEDGVGFSFVPIEVQSSTENGPGSHPADKKTLDKFLRLASSDRA